MRTFVLPLCLSWIFVGLIGSAFGASSDVETDVLHVRAEVTPSIIPAGGQAELQIHLDLAKGHHAYSDRFKLKVIDPDFFVVNSISISPTVEFFDKPSKSTKRGVNGLATLTALLEVSEKAPIGAVAARLDLTYQACTDDYCLLPQTIPVPLHFQVAAHDLQKPPVTDSNTFANALKQGTLYTFLFVFLMGVLTSFTPCIYPMIPITLAVIGSRSKTGTHWRGFILSVFYVLGMAVTYALVGLIVARTGALFGSVMSSPYVVSLIALVFVAMGLSMYGLFEMQAPAFIRNRLGSTKVETGLAGAFLTGLIAGVIASPCVGPVLVAILAYIAQTQNSMLGFFLLFTFALGMGLLLIFVGTFSHALKALPRSGSWMESVKFFFGTIMIGAALFYVSQIAPSWLVSGLAGVSVILIASAFGAFTPNTKLTPLTRLRKGLMLAALVVGCYLVVVALDHFVPVLPKTNSSATTQPQGGLVWETFSEEKLKQAILDKRPVIIDFWAEWCAACHELDEKTYTDGNVRKLGENFALFKMDATDANAEVTRLTQKYNVLGLPTVLFFDIKGQARPELTLAGFEAADDFLVRMQKALQE